MFCLLTFYSILAQICLNLFIFILVKNQSVLRYSSPHIDLSKLIVILFVRFATTDVLFHTVLCTVLLSVMCRTRTQIYKLLAFDQI